MADPALGVIHSYLLPAWTRTAPEAVASFFQSCCIFIPEAVAYQHEIISSILMVVNRSFARSVSEVVFKFALYPVEIGSPLLGDNHLLAGPASLIGFLHEQFGETVIRVDPSIVPFSTDQRGDIDLLVTEQVVRFGKRVLWTAGAVI